MNTAAHRCQYEEINSNLNHNRNHNHNLTGYLCQTELQFCSRRVDIRKSELTETGAHSSTDGSGGKLRIFEATLSANVSAEVGDSKLLIVGFLET